MNRLESISEKIQILQMIYSQHKQFTDRRQKYNISFPDTIVTEYDECGKVIYQRTRDGEDIWFLYSGERISSVLFGDGDEYLIIRDASRPTENYIIKRLSICRKLLNMLTLYLLHLKEKINKKDYYDYIMEIRIIK